MIFCGERTHTRTRSPARTTRYYIKLSPIYLNEKLLKTRTNIHKYVHGRPREYRRLRYYMQC